jgi:hypothetical protein
MQHLTIRAIHGQISRHAKESSICVPLLFDIMKSFAQKSVIFERKNATNLMRSMISLSQNSLGQAWDKAGQAIVDPNIKPFIYCVWVLRM